MTGTVVLYSSAKEDYAGSHEGQTRIWIAKRLAGLLGYEYGGEYDPEHRYGGPVYLVPNATLSCDESGRLGIRAEQNFFGGAVPHPFVATKCIAHPVTSGGAVPPGWSHEMGAHLGDSVLPGFTAFSAPDARSVGRRMLTNGPARFKAGGGIGGRGQAVVSDAAALDAALADLSGDALARWGVVIEENLEEIRTFSVGQVRVGDLHASYVGEQQLTQDNRGAEVYGGSTLIVARGGYDALLAVKVLPEYRTAVEHARIFDASAFQSYPGLLASRRNYDIAQGLDARGNRRMGVLEQSWRIGGASPAEIAALEAFRHEPRLSVVRSRCVETYGPGAAPPPGATVHFRGTDSRVGPICKSVLVEEYGNPA
jgi:hypothetical protein